MITRNVFESRFADDVATGKVLFDELMSKHTTFQIGGPADVFCMPESQMELVMLLRYALETGTPYMILGKGSNLLVSDKGVRGMVISTDRFVKISRDENFVSAFCGATLKDVSEFAAEIGLSGLEFAHGIPGSVGGAVFMNAGAYGGEIKDVLYCSKCLEPRIDKLDGIRSIMHIKAEDHDFVYRGSSLQSRGLIHLSSVFKLTPDDPDAIKARIADLEKQRWDKQPMEMPSAGSIFKRPEGHFTGKLVDDCGLRGYRIGDAAVSDKHCGFIVNLGQATAADVQALIAHVQTTVYNKFGVLLETEVRIVGEW